MQDLKHDQLGEVVHMKAGSDVANDHDVLKRGMAEHLADSSKRSRPWCVLFAAPNNGAGRWRGRTCSTSTELCQLGRAGGRGAIRSKLGRATRHSWLCLLARPEQVRTCSDFHSLETVEMSSPATCCIVLSAPPQSVHRVSGKPTFRISQRRGLLAVGMAPNGEFSAKSGDRESAA